MNRNGLRILSLVVSSYMLLALVWWTVLLSKENRTIKDLKIEILGLKQASKAYPSAEFRAIERTANRKSIMVLGEGIVFGLSLIIGLYLINRAYRRELAASDQQNNFLLAITHELKSPLTSMKMGLETLNRHHLTEDLKREIINDSILEGNRLESLINNLLLANKIDSKYKFEKQSLNVDEHITHYVNSQPQILLNQGIQLETNAGKVIYADEQALEIVYSNLIENASKYAKNTPLKIVTSRVGKNIIIKFEDQGVGIPIKYRKAVLNKFFRIGNEDTRTTKGTGLGLYIVKQIVEGHNGKLTIKDNIPQGCIIEIQIPISH